MPLRYACNNSYAPFKNKKLTMDKESLKEGTKDTHYVNVKPPVFQIQYYDIKSGKI